VVVNHNHIKINLYILGLLLLCAAGSNAQVQPVLLKGRVINYFTNEVIPFASVRWKRDSYGAVTDSSGSFRIRKTRFELDTLVVSYVGFEEAHHPYHAKKDTGELVLTLPEVKVTGGVEVKSKFNKGLRWWRSIVAHKKENDPYQFNSYSYELYNKLELDINNLNRKSFDSKLLKPFAFVLNNIDSTSETRPFLPIFLTETISDYYSSTNPYRTREEIKAALTNGIKNETVMQFMSGVSQKVNVYEDYITIFGKEFISPISNIGDKFYSYHGADTQTIDKQKFFHLFFSPRQEGSNTFSGDCWVNSISWAVQRINLNISVTANINFVNKLSIIQEFRQLDNGKWVFSKDKFIADLSPLKKDKLSFIGRKTSTYKNVQVNLPSTTERLSKNKIKEEVVVRDTAETHAPDFWEVNRHEPLSRNENKVYTMIDTLKHMPVFQKYSNAFQFIFDGHKKYGMVEIGPWYKWISGNQHEKLRLRFDLGTTTKFSQHLRLFGYLAYGFLDTRFKGKAAFSYNLNHHESWNFSGSYIDDLDNGRIRYNEDDDATTDNLFSQLIRRQGIRQKFLGVKEFKGSVTKQWPYNLSTQVSFTNASYETYGPLPSQTLFSLNNNGVINTEAIFKVRYAPGEKEIATHRRKIRIKGLEPVIEARYAQSLPDVFKGEYSYHKLSLQLSQTFRIPRWGQIEYLAYGGKYFGDSVPFMLLEIHPGNEIYYYNKQSFNLMNRFEYISDQYAGFNVEHNFEKKLFNLVPFMRKTKMRQFWNFKAVWGDLSRPNSRFNVLEFGSYRLKILRGRPYMEIGTGIDNILKFFRIDLVWRMAPQFTPPPGSTVPNNPQNFGIFGSFRLQF